MPGRRKNGLKQASPTMCRICGAVRRFTSSAADGGNVVVLFGLSVPVLVGAVGLAIDVGLWELAHKSLQRAADSAAMSAAISYQASGSNIVPYAAKAIAADYGFVDGTDGATVTVNRPPSSGPNTSNNKAIEVIITQSQPRIFSTLFGNQSVVESGRAAAVASSKACVLALDKTAANSISAQGSVSVTASGCSIYSDSSDPNAINAGGSASMSALAIGARGGISGESNMTSSNGFTTNGGIIGDPYSGVTVPSFSGCDQTNFTSKKTETISPGVYCNGFTLNAGANVTMSPGIYYMDQGTLTVNGSATLSGTGVTIIFTSSSKANSNTYATAKINGGANVSLTAPTTGTTAGIVLFGDPKMPAGTSFALAGGASQIFNGATYIPKGSISYAGGASGYDGCSQVIADTVTFSGGSNLAINCSGTGVKQIGSAAQLLE